MKQNRDFTTGSIPVKLTSFMMPILAALILQAMYGAVDLYMVGQYGSTAGLSAVSTGSGIINFVTFTICGLTTGVTVLIGRYLGERKQNEIGEVVGGVIWLFGIISVVLTIVVFVFAKELSVLMKAPVEALELTIQYVQICAVGLVFVIAYNVISSIFRGLGNSNLPLLFVAIAALTNMVGDYVLVAIMQMNVAGAAIATIGAQAISVILSLWIIKKNKMDILKFKKEHVCCNRQVKKFVKIGAPLALQEMLTNFTFMALMAFINNLGLDASSGYAIAHKVQSFVMLIPSSIMQSMAPFVAQNVGAGLEKRSRQAMACGMAIGGGIGIVIFYFTFFHGDVVSALFTKDTAVIIRSFEYLKGFAPEAIVTSIAFSYLGYFNGHGKSVFVMAQGLGQSFLIRLPMSYIMSIQPNASLTNIGLAAPTATVFGIIVCSIYFVICDKKEKRSGDNYGA